VSELLCIKTPPFLREFSNQKKSPKTPGNALSDALLKSRFQKFARLQNFGGLVPKKKFGFLKPRGVLQPIVDEVAQNLEIISKTFLTNQNSAHGIY